ncbi:hypothetical protein M231_00980 [Tremella mesenterica]|uniref:Uncharacterized protein n=1 Tax=Tremella mesenterica TaxID=5217 RepID=A0A4Q1BUJ3_TREME|nr:uncharacterized protein TREMEDRAFT_61617 [Tremella mesenterica DSM 1558]EIW69847.1 hypothetical protein TREMEDRAFT_61617 [Tremella mesenterica DSM 1558]RXK41745.1 hypothetical protein M231_00980 [Tremella mesenterica]
MPDPFGSFRWICQHAPLPQCNLFFSQLYNSDNGFTTLFPSTSAFFNQYHVTGTATSGDNNLVLARGDAGTGVGANCEIAHVGHRGSIGDVALIVLSALSVLVAVGLTYAASRRKAAVGRMELRLLLIVFGLHSVFQLLTMSSIFEQGSTALSILSSIHLGFVAVFFWLLLGNALIATQVVEDGTPAALVPLMIIAILFFAPTLYISLDTALSWTSAFQLSSSHFDELKSIGLFILTLIWPAVAAVGYLIIMLVIVLKVLNEVKPALFYILAFMFFAGGQVIFFLASQPLCNSSNGKINGAFLSTLLNTASIGSIYYAWMTITEDDWGDELGY